MWQLQVDRNLDNTIVNFFLQMCWKQTQLILEVIYHHTAFPLVHLCIVVIVEGRQIQILQVVRKYTPMTPCVQMKWCQIKIWLVHLTGSSYIDILLQSSTGRPVSGAVLHVLRGRQSNVCSVTPTNTWYPVSHVNFTLSPAYNGFCFVLDALFT